MTCGKAVNLPVLHRSCTVTTLTQVMKHKMLPRFIARSLISLVEI